VTKNKLEKMFSKSLKAEDAFWGMKLHNNPLAHQNTPADYILTYEYQKNYEMHLKTILVECKQVTCDDYGRGRLTHKRLKQMHDMLSFENKFNNHKAFWCIAFYNSRWDKSDIYLIPVRVMYGAIQAHSMVSFNRIDFDRIFADYRVFINGGVIPLNLLI